ncbi:GGDN family [Micromonospora rhizosphaerae]|uniref:GGDN family n=1 Tax=Micromonospora rhizosphaerae TaxID=568872 RepID=A0A1C6SBA0_9ACTN|nr:hypothetical protein [Micromonospora rhizosphaerae]SCL26664.1 GGDN family [Micromonospora rhizosphaerae]
MGEAGSEGLGHKLTVGVVGTADVVATTMHLGADFADGPVDFRLVAVAYEDEGDIARELARVQPELDVCLFAGPLPYDLAREAGAIAVPATFVPLSGSALYGTLLRAVLDGGYDLRRVSVDSVPRREVDEAYAEIGVSADDVHVLEYSDPSSPSAFESFHSELHLSGTTTVALTSVRSVAQRLTKAGVPVLLVRPTKATVRIALRTALLLGLGSRLEESQIAIGIVEAPVGGGDFGSLRLALHGLLLDEARGMGATVLPRDERGYYVVATLGSLVAATEDFAVPPFVERVRAELGIDIELGIGLGETAREAEANARAALIRSRTDGEHDSYLVGHDGHVLMLPSRPRVRLAAQNDARTKAAGTLARLVAAIRSDGDMPTSGPVVVDASTVANLLDITPRAARRLLHALAELGLAWQMPPARAAGPGRPRQSYRLMVERLG